MCWASVVGFTFCQGPFAVEVGSGRGYCTVELCRMEGGYEGVIATAAVLVVC